LIDGPATLALHGSHQIYPVRPKQDLRLVILQFDQLPRIELRRRYNLNPNLIAILGKSDSGFPCDA
jgi:hypothetical protein